VIPPLKHATLDQPGKHRLDPGEGMTTLFELAAEDGRSDVVFLGSPANVFEDHNKIILNTIKVGIAEMRAAGFTGRGMVSFLCLQAGQQS